MRARTLTRGWTLLTLAFLLALLIGALPSTALGKTIYVSKVGSDTAGYGTASAPLATIARAFYIAFPGDVVHLGAGTWDGGFDIPTGLTVEGSGADETTITGSGFGLINPTAAHSSWTLRKLTLANNREAIWLGETGSQLIEDCRITGITEVAVFSNGGRATIVNCLFDSNSINTPDPFDSLVYAYGGSTFINDTFVNNSDVGPWGTFTDIVGDGFTATNCIFWDTDAPFGNGATTSHCDAKPSASLVGTGDVTATPSFASTATGDFRLSASSPLIDKATATGAPAFDLNGTARPWGAGYDIGAYEFFVPRYVTATSLSTARSVKAKHKLTLSGSVTAAGSPYVAPGTVKIAATRRVGKRWKSAGTVNVTLSGGTFACSFKPASKGSWRFVATYGGGAVGPSTYLPSASGIVGISVK